MIGQWNNIGVRTRSDIKGWVQRSIWTKPSKTYHFNHTKTCTGEGGMKEVKKKKTLAWCPKNVSNGLTDHIPTHKSQSRNHIQTHNSTGERGIAVERLSEKRRASLTVQWVTPIDITWRNPTNGSEIVPCCQRFFLKSKRKKGNEGGVKEARVR